MYAVSACCVAAQAVTALLQLRPEVMDAKRITIMLERAADVARMTDSLELLQAITAYMLTYNIALGPAHYTIAVAACLEARDVTAALQFVDRARHAGLPLNAELQYVMNYVQSLSQLSQAEQQRLFELEKQNYDKVGHVRRLITGDPQRVGVRVKYSQQHSIRRSQRSPHTCVDLPLQLHAVRATMCNRSCAALTPLHRALCPQSCGSNSCCCCCCCCCV